VGLGNRLTPRGEALPAALALAAQIACNGPFAVRVAKQIVDGVAAWSPDDAWARQDRLLAAILASQYPQEGAARLSPSDLPSGGTAKLATFFVLHITAYKALQITTYKSLSRTSCRGDRLRPCRSGSAAAGTGDPARLQAAGRYPAGRPDLPDR
jgi:hypothetical protein